MKLVDYLDEHGISEAEFAKKIEMSRAAVYRYCKLERIPEIPLLIRIKHATGGKVSRFEDWLREGDETWRTQQ